MEEIRDCLGRLACCGNAATGYVSSLYKGHRTTAYLSIGETFTVERDNTITVVTRITTSAFKVRSYRIAAYCRVSTGSDAQLESLDAQKTHYENYINGREDWEFAGLYFDEGISGTKKEKRPALLQMIADCKAGKIDFVITKSISRFARNTTDCLEMVRMTSIIPRTATPRST